MNNWTTFCNTKNKDDLAHNQIAWVMTHDSLECLAYWNVYEGGDEAAFLDFNTSREISGVLKYNPLDKFRD